MRPSNRGTDDANEKRDDHELARVRTVQSPHRPASGADCETKRPGLDKLIQQIHGPIWVPRDSGYNVGLPVFPDYIHQLNWGLAGMAMLNGADAKVRRFKFSAQNEGLFPPSD